MTMYKPVFTWMGAAFMYLGSLLLHMPNDSIAINSIPALPALEEQPLTSTLFLIDRSGSMSGIGKSGKTKWQEAKEAALEATSYIFRSQNPNQQVAFLTFSGACSNDPTNNQALTFSTNAAAVETQLKRLGNPGGGTPLHEAVLAAKKRLQDHLALQGIDKKTKIIVLSDGAATCARVRPPEVYGTGTVFVPIGSGQHGQQTASSPYGNTKATTAKRGGGQGTLPNSLSTIDPSSITVNLFTVGFDIQPGSAAERDLQYLAQQTGGKYLNTQNQTEIVRAFSEFIEEFLPKKAPSTEDLSFEALNPFLSGVEFAENQEYRSARLKFERFVKDQPKDANGAFNLGLMYDVNQFYIRAIEHYGKYLELAPQAEDGQWVTNRILLAQENALKFREYSKKILEHDLKYLDEHFKKIQNGEGQSLSEEFKGFIAEKKYYYEDLPLQLGIEAKPELRRYKEITRGLETCAKLIRKDPKNWDKNATSPLSLVFFNLEGILEKF